MGRREQRHLLAAAAADAWHRLGVVRETFGLSEANAERGCRTSTGRTLAFVVERRELVRAAVARAEDAAGVVTATSPDGIRGASGQRLVAAERALDEFIRRLDACEQAFDALAALSQHIDRLRGTLPARLRSLALAYQEAEVLVAGRRAEGWPVEPLTGRLHQLRPRIFDLDLTRATDDWLTVAAELTAIGAELTELIHDVRTMDDRLATLRRAHGRLTAAVGHTAARVAAARRELAALAAGPSAESLDPVVAGYPERAANLLSEAGRAQARGAVAADLDRPDTTDQRPPSAELDEAELAFDEANRHLGAAIGLLDELDRRRLEVEARMGPAGSLAPSHRQHRNALERRE